MIFQFTPPVVLRWGNLNPEDEASSPKIDRLMTNYISKLKWARQTQFLSYTLLLLQINVTFYDVQMMLQQLFDISTGFRFTKKLFGVPVHF